MIHLLRLRLFTFLVVYFLKSQEKKQITPPHVPSSWRRGHGGGEATVQKDIRH